MPVAAAVVGSAVIGAGASLAAASKGSKAQKQAAQLQQQTERENLALQERIFNQQREDLAPWREAGAASLGELVRMTQPGFDTGALENDPGFRFRMEQGRRAIDASAAARGTLRSGATLKALTRFAQGTASDEFGQRFNRLASIAGIGQTANNATGQAAQNFGAQAASAYRGIGEGFANVGNARASSYAGAAQGINNLASGVGNYFTMRQFMQPQQTSIGALTVNGAGSGAAGYRAMYNPSFQPLFG